MAENKKSIIIYADWGNVFDELSDEEAGQLIKHFFDYVRDKNPEPKNKLTKIAFEPMKLSLKRDLEKWNGIKEKRSLAGQISAENRKKQSATNSTHVESVQQTSTNSTVSVNVNVSDSVNGNVIKKVDNVNLDDRKLAFSSTLKPFLEKYDRDMLKAFYNYWTEPNKSQTKMRFESEKFWDLSKRLSTWYGNEKFKSFDKGEEKKAPAPPPQTIKYD